MSSMVLGLAESGIRRIMNMAMEIPGVTRLEVGEPLFPTPPHIIEAALAAAREGYTKYTGNSGIPSLRNAIAERVSDTYGLRVAAEQVGVTVGAVGAISGVLRALVDQGDHVLLPDPGWPNYHMMCMCVGAVPVRYPLPPENGFLPDPAAIEGVLTDRSKVMVVNSPSNPLGTVFPEDLVRDLVAFARAHDLYLISDEVYEKIIFEGGHTPASAFDTDGRVIVASGFSKTYAMTGWRVGYAVAAEPIIRQLGKLQEAYVSCTPAPSQKAAEAALAGPQDCVAAMRETYRENRAVAKEVLDRHGIPYVEPHGAFYLWVEVGCEDSTGFALGLLEKKKVSVAPGSTFGPSGEGFVRISLASAGDDIRTGLTALADFREGR